MTVAPSSNLAIAQLAHSLTRVTCRQGCLARLCFTGVLMPLALYQSAKCTWHLGIPSLNFRSCSSKDLKSPPPGGPLQFKLQTVSYDRHLWLPRIVQIVYDPDGKAPVVVKRHQTVSTQEVKFLDDRCENSMGSQGCHDERHEVLCALHGLHMLVS